MKYYISYQYPQHHFIHITLYLRDINKDITYLQLPSWRPGRYELGNFAKNIQRFNIQDMQGGMVPHKKVSKDRWEVVTKGIGELQVKYTYYGNQMDAGGTYLDEEQLYINFINCMLYAEGRLNQPCEVHLQLPHDYRIACSLKQVAQHTLEASDYYELVDSPMIASNRLQQHSYLAGDTIFHLWAMGDSGSLNWPLTQEAFRRFSEVQIKTMQGFPAPEYHFLFQFLPYKAYHGVEHGASTVVTLGPSNELHLPDLYKNLLGISSHELYHVWNIIRIRPAEMMPYDFTKENYFTTGFVAEGVTTYYGDLFLARGGVFDLDEYLVELNRSLQRHVSNGGRFNHSLIDSGFDLWLDGYSPGIPNRKVSIYVKGSLVALLLDLQLRKLTNNERSLDNVMQLLMQEFALKQKGYTYEDYKKIVERVAGQPMDEYFRLYVEGLEPLENHLPELLEWVGLSLRQQPARSSTQRLYGFKVGEKEGNVISIQDVAPGSPAEKHLSRGDELVAINGRRIQLNNLEELLAGQDKVVISFFRNHTLRTVELAAGESSYKTELKILPLPNPSPEQLQSRQAWLWQ
ncbi:M61 family metallopeptidase [Cesiribacter sp. SM1]|uniref:M61 family metallopeptidase n=1 Tax=Cesiribacter sp. SM1 TaxID=2861196 RepID=UPI001CD5C51A|nr:PDZ domain-containing protein [Cesiribacter sp. SM1]